MPEKTYINKADLLKQIAPKLSVFEDNARDKSDSEKYFKYGLLYEKGELVPRNLNIALDYFMKAISKGNLEAQAHAGAIYAGVISNPTNPVSIDIQKGLSLLTEAANNGNQTASKFLRRITSKTPV